MKPSRDGEPAPHWEGAVAFRLFADRPRPTLTVAEQIAAQVGERILDGRLPPGARLDEQHLAGEFGVSRGTLREATRLLEREGLVHVVPRHGAMVTALSADELREIYEVRAALFDSVLRKLAKTRPAALFALQRDGVARLRTLADGVQDGDEYAETMHRLLLVTASHAGNRRLQRLLAGLSLQTLRYSKLALRSVARRQRSLALWTQALEALERGDADTVAALSGLHFEESGAEAARLLATDPAQET